MNTPELVEWQKLAPNGLVYPWWTHPCLDVIEQWDLKEKTWLEFGAGLSTAWLRSRCEWVDSIEANISWAVTASQYAIENGLFNGAVYSSTSDLPDGIPEQRDRYFRLIPDGSLDILQKREYDIISVDGIWRNECLQWALDHFKGRGGILVVDNMDQDFVWISPSANELMAPYHCEIYYQPGHTNHDGKPWNTRIYTIPA